MPRLAAVTGYPPGNLAWALPELRKPGPDWLALRHLARRACPRCTARHQGGPVRRLFAHHEYLCIRHGYWTGPPDPSRDDPPLPLAAQVPELAAAQRTLDRTRRLHGWEAAFDATVVATSICIELRIRTMHQPLYTRWERHLEVLMPGPYRRALFMAAIFPEAAALAAVLPAAPGAGSLPSAARHALRYAEPPGRHDLSDTLSIWARDREAGWGIRPDSAYSHAGHRDDGTARITDGRLTAERQTATRFRRDRRAPFIPSPGLPMPTPTCLVRGPLPLSCWPPCPPEAEKPGSRGNGWVSGTHTRRRCPGESGSERLLAACPPQPIPPAAGRFDRLPVALRPLGRRHQQHVERAAEVSELIQRGRLDPPTVEVAGNEPVAFRSAKRLGQHLVRDAIQGIVEVLVTAASLKEPGKHSERPTSREKSDERNGWSPLLGGGWFGLAVQWLAGHGVSLARVARSKTVMISRE